LQGHREVSSDKRILSGCPDWRVLFAPVKTLSPREERIMKAVRLGLPLFAACLILAGAQADEKGEKKQVADKPALAKEVLGKAKINLATAIETAQKKVPDGKPFAARVEMHEGKPAFGAYFLVGDTITEVEIDSTRGDMLEVREKKENPSVHMKSAADVRKALEGAKVTLSNALAIGTDRIKDGKPFEVEMELADGKPIVEVELLAGEKVMKVRIDAVDANQVKVVEAKKK
jgi:hypothetical protein